MRQEHLVSGSHNEQSNRRADDSWRAHVAERMEALEKQIAANTTLTEAIKANTDEIVTFFQAGKGFFAVVRVVGSAARWLAIIAAASGIAYGIVEFGLGQLLSDLGVTKK